MNYFQPSIPASNEPLCHVTFASERAETVVAPSESKQNLPSTDQVQQNHVKTVAQVSHPVPDASAVVKPAPDVEEPDKNQIEFVRTESESVNEVFSSHLEEQLSTVSEHTEEEVSTPTSKATPPTLPDQKPSTSSPQKPPVSPIAVKMERKISSEVTHRERVDSRSAANLIKGEDDPEGEDDFGYTYSESIDVVVLCFHWFHTDEFSLVST